MTDSTEDLVEACKNAVKSMSVAVTGVTAILLSIDKMIGGTINWGWILLPEIMGGAFAALLWIVVRLVKKQERDG